MEQQSLDKRFVDACAEAARRMRAGHGVYQNFTCARCEARQTLKEPNRFQIKGKCKDCGYQTDLMKFGCNYVLIEQRPGQQR